jgi:hypothetical protein
MAVPWVNQLICGGKPLERRSSPVDIGRARRDNNKNDR